MYGKKPEAFQQETNTWTYAGEKTKDEPWLGGWAQSSLLIS